MPSGPQFRNPKFFYLLACLGLIVMVSYFIGTTSRSKQVEHEATNFKTPKESTLVGQLPSSEEVDLRRRRDNLGSEVVYDWGQDWRRRRRHQGGSRGCSGSLAAILPPGDTLTTVSPNPSIWIYIAEEALASDDATPRFVLLNAEGNEIIFSGTFSLPESAGIMKLSLPDNLSLAVGEQYQWSLSLSTPCYGGDAEGELQVNGSIAPIVLPDTIAEQIAAETQPINQAILYAEANAWNETVDILVTGLASSQGNISEEIVWQEDWTALLETIRLEELAAMPFVDCCTLEANP
jgi:hypothetical protein